MIKLLQSGEYQLTETKGQTKILTLDSKKTYAWVNAIDIGEILVVSYKEHATDTTLAIGKYRLYEVFDEPDITDLIHLELFVGGSRWQGYLLPTGLPKEDKTKSRIIPTNEVITKAT